MSEPSVVTHSTSPEGSPYLGLRPFETQDAAFFFGRSRDVELLAANLRSARTSLIYGQSGVGKSSLLRAGLAPALLRRSAQSGDAGEERDLFAAVVFTMSRQDPTRALSRQVAAATSAAAGVADESLGEGDSFFATLSAATRRVDRVLIVLDQFEEYLAYAESSPSDWFAEDFSRALTHSELPVHFMVAIREDSVARLDRFRARTRELLANPIRIDPLTADSAREAIYGPLGAYNRLYGTAYRVEPGLEDVIIDATRPGMLDLGFGGRGGLDTASKGAPQVVEAAYLQVVLQHIWEAEREETSREMRVATFQRLGGLAGIVRRHLDQIMSEFSTREQRVASTAFRYLVTPSGMKVPYSSWDLAELTHREPEVVESVLERLASEPMRILRPLTPARRNERRYEIYHDRLADPILDWRVRRETGGERLGTVRVTSVVAGVLALVAALLVGIFAGNSPAVSVLALYGAVFFLTATIRPAAQVVARMLDLYRRSFDGLFERMAFLTTTVPLAESLGQLPDRWRRSVNRLFDLMHELVRRLLR